MKFKNMIKLLVLVAFAFVITTPSVLANADATGGDWIMTPQEKAEMAEADKMVQESREEEHDTVQDDMDRAEALQKQQDAEYKRDVARNEAEFDKGYKKNIKSAKHSGKKNVKNKKHVIKENSNIEKHATKSNVSVEKHTTKKNIAKKSIKNNTRRLLMIKIKTNKVYAYRNINLHNTGRKLEKKGTKLDVYGIIKKGGKTYYKIYDGHVISADEKLVTRISK